MLAPHKPHQHCISISVDQHLKLRTIGSMNLTFIEESSRDHAAVTNLIKAATADLPDIYKSIYRMVERSRKSDVYLPKLSIVVKHQTKVIGHTSVVKTQVKELVDEFGCLMMISHHVHPEYQNRGVGCSLLESIHNRAKGLGYKSIVLQGNTDYYGRFGYIRSATADIIMPPNTYRGQALIKQLAPGGLLNMHGSVQLPDILTGDFDEVENDSLTGSFD